jgi:hypothetical protein
MPPAVTRQAVAKQLREKSIPQRKWTLVKDKVTKNPLSVMDFAQKPPKNEENGEN